MVLQTSAVHPKVKYECVRCRETPPEIFPVNKHESCPFLVFLACMLGWAAATFKVSQTFRQ
jgi:hypothetical protein